MSGRGGKSCSGVAKKSISRDFRKKHHPLMGYHSWWCVRLLDWASESVGISGKTSPFWKFWDFSIFWVICLKRSDRFGLGLLGREEKSCSGVGVESISRDFRNFPYTRWVVMSDHVGVCSSGLVKVPAQLGKWIDHFGNFSIFRKIPLRDGEKDSWDGEKMIQNFENLKNFKMDKLFSHLSRHFH